MRGKPRSGKTEVLIHPLRRFIGLTLAISWGLCGLSLLVTVQLWSKPSIPQALLLLSACAPSGAALALVGPRALIERLRRPFPLGLAAALIAIPAIAMVAGAGPAPAEASFWPLALVAPIGEEFGWRGFALPQLLRRFAPALATLLVAAMWIAWHFPAFLVPGAMRQSGGDIAWWALGTTALSFVMTWLYLRGNGNLLIAGIVPHAMVNLLGAFGLWSYTPLQTCLLTAFAAGLLALDRRRFFEGPAPTAPG